MSHSDLRWIAVLESSQGEHIADLPFEPDLVPAEAWAEFELGLRTGDWVAANDPVIEPVWYPGGQPPFIRAVRIRCDEDSTSYSEFPITYFADAISARASKLIESGQLAAGQRFDYRIYVLKDQQACERPSPPNFTIKRIPKRPRLIKSDLRQLLADSRRVIGGEGKSAAMPVFISERVLKEAASAASGAGDIETGGILVGHLCTDADDRLFARVTAQIPAEHTEATRESLRFKPETWLSVDSALRLRQRDESILGWWHAHPWFCRNCPAERRAACAFSKPAFSTADRALHREVFLQPWNIALLLSYLGNAEPSFDVFAWQRGLIEPIEFLTLPYAFDEGDSR